MTKNSLLSSMMISKEELFQKLSYSYSIYECDRIKKAWDFAENVHNGQFRKNGEPYFCHIQRVVCLLVIIDADPITIIAGLLHDIVEDTSVTESIISHDYGYQVLSVVRAVSKIHEIISTNIPILQKMSLLKEMGKAEISIFLSERYERTLTEPICFAEQTVKKEIHDNLDLYIPLANYYNFEKLASGIRLLSKNILSTNSSDMFDYNIGSESNRGTLIEKYYDSANEKAKNNRYTEAEIDYENAINNAYATIDVNEDTVELLVRSIDGLGWCLRKQGRLEEAIIKYQELKEIMNTHMYQDLSRYYFDLCIALRHLGKCYLCKKMFHEAEKELIAAQSACESHLFYSASSVYELHLQDAVYYDLAVLYSFIDSRLDAAEANMLKVRNIRTQIAKRKQNVCALASLHEVYTALIDIANWRQHNASVYESEIQAINSRLSLLKKNKKAKRTE